VYTRCPECQTAFKITVAQLKARDGLVRCGRCDSVFRADLRLFAPPSADGATQTTLAATAPEDDSEFIDLDARDDAAIPVITDFSVFQAPRRGPPAVVWAFGILVALTLLAAQFFYFYRNELAQLPQLRSPLAQFCALLRCRLFDAQSAAVPQLEKTQIAPHPRYANVLRIRASLVNRSDHAQRLPLMEVSLTDNDGKLLARRTFTPREYLETLPADVAPLAAHVAVSALIDVTNPDGKAAGYEVRLFAPQYSRAN